MKKLDAILAAIIGFLNGIFFFFLLWRTGKALPYGLPGWILIILFPPLGVAGLFLAYLLGKRVLILFQAAKFFFVGTLNTFIDLGVVSFFIWISGVAFGILYAIFKAISFLAATTNSYFWNKYWTFEKRKETPGPGEFFKFLVVTTIGLSINVGVASFTVDVIKPQFGLGPEFWASIVAPIIAAFSAFLWNFFASKFIVFKK